MSTRLSWIRCQTTIEDLLDDGVENFSDLKGSDAESAPEDEPDAAVLAAKQQSRDIMRREAAAENARHTSALSWTGTTLGLLIAASGTMLVVFPVEMRVEHPRTKYLPTVREHVTPARSRLYGAALVVAGMAVTAYSLYRPRKPN